MSLRMHVLLLRVHSVGSLSTVGLTCVFFSNAWSVSANARTRDLRRRSFLPVKKKKKRLLVLGVVMPRCIYAFVDRLRRNGDLSALPCLLIFPNSLFQVYNRVYSPGDPSVPHRVGQRERALFEAAAVYRLSTRKGLVGYAAVWHQARCVPGLWLCFPAMCTQDLQTFQ